jgi:penicillin amidase
MSLRRRILIVGLTIIVLLLLVGVGAGVITVRRSFPRVDGMVELNGPHSSIDVYRDEWGVPQIYASNAHDLFFAQGYVHAQDRFWEMDFRRHVTSGRLSEMFGDSQIETDRFIRTLGWRRVAEREIELLRPETRSLLDAYADGVNAYLEDHQGSRLSLEYVTLALTARGYEPEPWSPADSVTWLKAMAWDLRANIEEEMERARLAATLPVRSIEDLYPPYPFERHQPIVTEGVVRGGRFVDESSDARVSLLRKAGVQRALDSAAAAFSEAPELLGPQGGGLGSNSWAVDGSLTESRSPLLANDPHLAPTMPSVWYQMGLHCTSVTPSCPYDVAGYTFSGFPGVIIGHNDRIAWGFTNLGADVTDLYLERISGSSYSYDGERLPLLERTERIEVAGGDPVKVTVRSTRHGPLISDPSSDFRDIGRTAPTGGARPRDGYAVALRWTALRPGRTADTVFQLNRARNYNEFRNAARGFEVPSQNLLYADIEGNIAYQAPGRIPIRRGYDGRWPVEGWTSNHDWKGYIEYGALPRVLNPPEGFIATANQAAAPEDYPLLLTGDWSYGYRSQRIIDLLEELPGSFTLDDMAALQVDSYTPLADILLPYFRDLDATGDVAQARALFNGWDGMQSVDSAPAAYLNAVWRNLLGGTFHDELKGPLRPEGGDRWFEVMRALLAEPQARWWDDVRTDTQENRDDQLEAALASGQRELSETLGDDPSDWRWGELHTLDVRNQSFGESGVAALEWLYNRGPLELGGGESIVDATGWTASRGYEVDWVPSMRMIVDLSDLDASRWVNLTGASGHAFHPNYFDQAELWKDGRTTPWPFERAAIEERAADHLILQPEA